MSSKRKVLAEAEPSPKLKKRVQRVSSRDKGKRTRESDTLDPHELTNDSEQDNENTAVVSFACLYIQGEYLFNVNITAHA